MAIGGANTISGGAGDDVFRLSNGTLANQTLDGGAGIDTVDFSATAGGNSLFVVGFDIDLGYKGSSAAFSGDRPNITVTSPSVNLPKHSHFIPCFESGLRFQAERAFVAPQ